MVQRRKNCMIKENFKQMESSANPMQRLRKMFAELVLEKIVEHKISKEDQPISWEVAQTEILLARTVHNSEKRSSLLILMLFKIFFPRITLHWLLIRLENSASC